MIRRMVAVVGILVFGGCASTRVASQDFTTGSLVICGNKYAELADLSAKAAQTCKNPQILRCAEQKYGSQTTATGSTYVATATTKDLTGNCCEFQCSR